MLELITKHFKQSKHDFTDRIRIFQGDILSHTDVDAVVTFITADLGLGGPLNRAFLSAAGDDLTRHIMKTVGKPKPGEVFLVPGFGSPMKHILLAVLPEWQGGTEGEDRALVQCYRGAVLLSQERGLRSLAFPSLGAGRLEFPHIRFARLALQGIVEGMDGRLEDVRIVCKGSDMAGIYTERLKKARRRFI